MSFYEEKFQRNPLTKRQQEKVRSARFAVVGLGGTGGFILENLIRMGAEDLVLFDNDRFDLSNFNRQSLATEDFLDMPKVHAALARARAVNAGIRIEAHGSFGEGSPLEGVSVLLDGTDNLGARLAMSKEARRKGIPYVFSSAQGTRGIVSVFTSYPFGKAFQVPPGGAPDSYAGCSSIMCPAASLSGSLASSQAVNLLIRKPFVKAPEAIFFDLFRKEVFWRGRLG